MNRTPITAEILARAGFRRPVSVDFPEWPWWQFGNPLSGELFIRFDDRRCRYADRDLNGCAIPFPETVADLQILCCALHILLGETD